MGENQEMSAFEKRSMETDDRVISNIADEVEKLLKDEVPLESAMLQAMQQSEKDSHINNETHSGVAIKNSGMLRVQILAELEKRKGVKEEAQN